MGINAEPSTSPEPSWFSSLLFYSQYDNEDFDLGIKQFMIEQQIQAELEDGLDRKGGNDGFEEKLSQALFADEDGEEKDTIKVRL